MNLKVNSALETRLSEVFPALDRSPLESLLVEVLRKTVRVPFLASLKRGSLLMLSLQQLPCQGIVSSLVVPVNHGCIPSHLFFRLLGMVYIQLKVRELLVRVDHGFIHCLFENFSVPDLEQGYTTHHLVSELRLSLLKQFVELSFRNFGSSVPG